jgi:hypothetical protein
LIAVRIVLAVSLAVSAATQILDRTAAVVGSRAIAASEVELQIRLQALFNGNPLDLSPQARVAALDRLVEQRLIEADMALAGLSPPDAQEADRAFQQLRQERFGGLAFDEAVRKYGVSETDARQFLLKQMGFARYVQLRFRAGLQADEAQTEAAYRRRVEGLTAAPALEDIRDELRRQVLDEQAEAMLNERVRQLRAETRIAYLDPIPPEPEAAP